MGTMKYQKMQMKFYLANEAAAFHSNFQIRSLHRWADFIRWDSVLLKAR